MKSCFRFLLVCFLAFTSLPALAQKAQYFGFNTTLETSSSHFQPSLGVIYEQRITKRSGIETGVFYRNYIHNIIITITDQTNWYSSNIRLSERYFSIPVLYKFHTSWVNISAGPSFEFYLGWKQKSANADINLTDYSGNPAFNIGLLTKISRSIRLNEQFNLEPEVRFNPILTNDRGYLGFGLAAKYKL